MDDTIDEKSINKRFNAKESNYKTSAPIVGNSLESRIFASRHDIDKIKELLTANNVDLSMLNEEYIKSFKELYSQYNSMNDELEDIIENFKNNIEYRKFSAEDSPFIFDKEFFEKWNLSEDKTKFTLSNLTNDFLNKEIEFEFKVKNVGFYCRKNITDYITKSDIKYTIKYYINDEEVTSFVKEYKREDYNEGIRFKVVFLISSISLEDNYINIDYNFFKQFATTNDDSKFYLTFNKLTDFFDINIPEEDQNVLSYSDENKRITFKSGYEDKTSEGIEDIIEEKDEDIEITDNRLYSNYDSSSSIVEKTMDLQSNIDNEKIIGIENNPCDESKEVQDGIEVKGNENGEDIVLTVKDRVVESQLSFVNKPNYIGKIEDQTDSSIIENNSDEFLENLEVKNINFIDIIKEKFPLYSSNQYTYRPVNLLLPDTNYSATNDNETTIINLKEYIDVQEFNNFTRLIIKEPKYFKNYKFAIVTKFTNSKRYYYIDVKGTNKVNFNNYNGYYDENNKKYKLYSSYNHEITIENIDILEFPVERPVTSEYIQNNGYSDIYNFIFNTSYWDLLSEDEKNIVLSINNGSSTMTEEEKNEFLMELYNKYEVDDDRTIIDIYEEDYSSSYSSTRSFFYNKINKIKIKYRFIYDAYINKNELITYFNDHKDLFGIGYKNNPNSGNYLYKLINFEITDQIQEAEIDFSDLKYINDYPIEFFFGLSASDFTSNFTYCGIIIEEIKVYAGSNEKMENVFIKNENIGTEDFKVIELNTPRINKLSFNYSKQNQNSEIVETEIEKHLITEDQIHISEGISNDTLNKNEKNEYSILIDDKTKLETSFEINIPIGNNKIEFEINPFSVDVDEEPIENSENEISNELTDDKYMAFYLNDSSLPFFVIDLKLMIDHKYGINEWQIISSMLNENIENKIIVKLFNYSQYFERISNMPIIRNIYYYKENINEKIAEETDVEKMCDGVSIVNGAIIISDPNNLYSDDNNDI